MFSAVIWIAKTLFTITITAFAIIKESIISMVKFVSAFFEYRKIGPYESYEPISKTLDDKDFEYLVFQIFGLKNLNDTAKKHIKKIAASSTAKDLQWLKESKSHLSEAFSNSVVPKIDELTPLELNNAKTYKIVRNIQKARTKLNKSYICMGCMTYGEASLMWDFVLTRIKQIEKGAAQEPNEFLLSIEKVLRELKAADISNVQISNQDALQAGTWID